MTNTSFQRKVFPISKTNKTNRKKTNTPKTKNCKTKKPASISKQVGGGVCFKMQGSKVKRSGKLSLKLTSTQTFNKLSFIF